jgi:prepilin-type N-terminal cleavage/methylation domain-containing protein
MRILKAGASNNAGFTLIELAMVILVIGIVSAIAMPRFGGLLERQQMRRTINAIRGYARYLQAYAASDKCVYVLMFDLDQQVLSTASVPALDCPGQTRRLPDYVVPSTVRILDVVTPENEKLGEGQVPTLFFPNGFVQPSVIHLGGIGIEPVTLMIEPLTGRIQVFDGYVERHVS